MQRGITNFSADTIANFLAVTPFFQEVKPESLKELALQFSPIFLRGGELLIREGDVGDRMYLVIQGRLRIYRQNGGSFDILNEVGRGDILGELALLTEEPRAATVCALRDSTLLQLSKKDFDRFVLANPKQLMHIVKYSLKRVMQHSVNSKVKINTLALLPAGSSDHQLFVKAFVESLRGAGTALVLDADSFDDLFLKQYGDYKKASQASFDSDISATIACFLSEQEEKYNFIIYVVDRTLSPWTRRCIRQADRSFLIANENENTALNTIEEYLFGRTALFRANIDLICLHPKTTKIPSNTAEWLIGRKVSSHHHLSDKNNEGMARLIRFILHKGQALVFGGGGARGLAHIGVYKALCELKIPVDMVGGSSAGAMLAAFIAMEYDWQMIRDTMYEFSVKNIKKLFDLTFPFVSIFGAKAWSSSLIKAYGNELKIEDLWRRFFCVATNISEHNLAILQQGLLWRAVRSSISLPGIVPPLSMDNQNLFVDGAVINNLPVDIMRKFSNEGHIIAVNVSSIQSLQSNRFPEGSLSGWGLLFKKLNPLEKAINPHVPSMPEIILQSIFLSSHQHAKESLAQADLYIDLAINDIPPLDFRAIDVLIERGYQITMQKLAKIKFD